MVQSEKWKFADILAMIVVLLCFAYFFTTSFALGKLDESSRSYVNQVGMACVGLLTFVLGYFYGSSKAGATKDATILSMQQENKDNTNPSVIIEKAENVTDNSKTTTDTANIQKAETVNANTANLLGKETRVKELEEKRDNGGLTFEEEKELAALKQKKSENKPT